MVKKEKKTKKKNTAPWRGPGLRSQVQLPNRSKIELLLVFADMSSGYIVSALSEVNISLIPRQSAYICCSVMVK